MRIITGQYKGKKIIMPKGIRPTQDKVRKALFDILGDLEGVSFLELFAGSGAVGFEAISRGAAEVTLVEYNRDCLLALKKNISSLKLESCTLYPLEAEKAIKRFHEENEIFDIVFLDPPYYLGMSKKVLQMLGVYVIVPPTGFVVVQHFKKDELPAKLGVLSLFRKSKYGDTVLSFYRKETVV
ncbi:MAG: 16S rRNA (guanine(966)-N(2))-methyltransferase RsmD [Candidatus Omnitrophica bacterium]|nr:16S rRNA (guanine(966)-N(2))-methyltransferase RsmD [Candidatus Omnitrophota bacterium]